MNKARGRTLDSNERTSFDITNRIVIDRHATEIIKAQ